MASRVVSLQRRVPHACGQSASVSRRTRVVVSDTADVVDDNDDDRLVELAQLPRQVVAALNDPELQRAWTNARRTLAEAGHDVSALLNRAGAAWARLRR